MNLSKIIYSIVLAVQVSVSAGTSSVAEDSSASAIRELIAKVNRLESSHKAEVDSLKAQVSNYDTKIANLEAKVEEQSATIDMLKSSATKPKNNVRRAQWAPPAPENPPEIPNDIPLDISDLSQADMQDIISSLGTDEQLSGVLYGLIHTVNKLVGLANCVSYEENFRRDSGEDACIIGSQNVDNTYILAGEDVWIDAPDDVYIEANDYLELDSWTIESYSFGLGQYSFYQESFVVFMYLFTEEYAKINGVMFPYNSDLDPYAIDGDKPASDGEGDKNSKARAKFDAMLEDKGYKAMFNTTSP